MARRTGHSRQEAGRGFTLVELLLTTALLLLLLGAAVFSISTLQRGRELEEGAARVEALLRFARAQAANTGRQVQINFEEEMAEGVSLSFGGIRALWEPDPVGNPGTFLDMPEADSFVQGITELVEVDSVRLIDPNAGESGGAPSPPTETVGELGEELPGVFPPVTFYPDGSGDSAEIMLRSVDADDARRVVVRIIGLTGVIRREFVAQELDELDEGEFEAERTEPQRKEAGAAPGRPGTTGNSMGQEPAKPPADIALPGVK